MRGMLILIAILILLAACQNSLDTVPTSEYVPTITEPVEKPEVEEPVVDLVVDLCEVECEEGQTCVNGECGCASGTKLCYTECIGEDACCEDDDCEEGGCREGECIVDEECRYGEELEDGRCGCAKNFKYCGDQKKCIDKGSCCIHGNCDRYERCVPTQWTTSFCIKIEEKKLCRLVTDLEKDELFMVKDNEFRVKLLSVLSDDNIKLQVDEEELGLLLENQNVTIGRATMFHEGVRVVGGYCKEDEGD